MSSNSDEQNPNLFGFSADIRDLCRKVQELELPDEVDGDPVEFWQNFYRELCTDFEILDWTYSRLARLKGMVLNKLYHVKAEKRDDSLLTRNQWTAFRANCREPDSTLENWRTIGDAFPLDNAEADSMGVASLLTLARGKEITDNIGKIPSSGPKDDHKRKSKPWTLNKHLSQSLDRLLAVVVGDKKNHVPTLAERIRATKRIDLKDNVNKSRSCILTERPRFKLLADGLGEAYHALAELEKELDDWNEKEQNDNRKQFEPQPLITGEVSGVESEDTEAVSAVLSD